MRRTAVMAVAFLISCSLTLTAAASTGSPRLHLLGSDLGFRVDDRYAVLLEESRRDIVARDTRTGRVRPYHTTCDVSGNPAAFHDRLLLLDCGGGTYALLDVGVGKTYAVAGSNDQDAFAAVGRQWLAGDTGRGPQAPSTVYLNWRTGERRTRPGFFSAAPPRDLDDPGLARRRTESQFGDVLPLHQGSAVVRRQPAPNGALVLHRKHKRILLSRCRAACSGVQFAPGLVVWSEGLDVRAYRLKDRKRLRWPGAGGKGAPIVGATSHEVFIIKWLEDPLTNNEAHTRLYRGRWR